MIEFMYDSIEKDSFFENFNYLPANYKEFEELKLNHL